MPRVRALLAVLAVGAMTAQPAVSQINEADRMARCQNNREAYARAESSYQIYRQLNDWSEESISRARTAMVSLRELARDVRDTIELDQNEEYHLNRVVARMIQTAASFGVFCMDRTPQCALGLPEALAGEIDRAVAGQHPVQIAARDMARYRTNLIALRCMEPGEMQIGAGPVSPPLTGAAANVVSISGLYYSSTTYRTYQVAQQGLNFTFQSTDGVESGSGTITVWPTTQRLTATLNGPGGTRTINGFITTSGTDPRQVWLLDWYGGYGPWQRRQ